MVYWERDDSHSDRCLNMRKTRAKQRVNIKGLKDQQYTFHTKTLWLSYQLCEAVMRCMLM